MKRTRTTKQNPFRGKVSKDAEKQIRQSPQKSKAQRKAAFAKLYDKPKTIRFNAKADMTRFITMPTFSLPGHPLSGDLSALATYVVLCSRSDHNEEKPIQISQANIAQLAGLNPGAVAEAIKRMQQMHLRQDRPIVDIRPTKSSDGKRRFNLYSVDFIRRPDMEANRNKLLYFHTCIVETGIWSQLKPRAKALYLGMRSLAEFDYELYCDIEKLDDTEFRLNYGTEFPLRKWEMFTGPLTSACNMMKIERSNIKEVMDNLIDSGLVESYDNGVYQLYLRPKLMYVENELCY